jgi:hypothetical protein
MFTKKNDPSPLDVVVNDLLARIQDPKTHTDEREALVKSVSKLYKLKEVDSKRKLSPDTLLMAAANILGIALIVGHERANVVTSKAIGFVMKLK